MFLLLKSFERELRNVTAVFYVLLYLPFLGSWKKVENGETVGQSGQKLEGNSAHNSPYDLLTEVNTAPRMRFTMNTVHAEGRMFECLTFKLKNLFFEEI